MWASEETDEPKIFFAAARGCCERLKKSTNEDTGLRGRRF
jgi:hypothetical protein